MRFFLTMVLCGVLFGTTYAQKAYKAPKISPKWDLKIKDYIRTNYPKSIRYCPEDKDWCTPLPYHFTSPCAVGFRNLFYWDTYFTNLGLLQMAPFDTLALNNVNNLLYQVNQYGYVPNFNRKSGTNRSQQPYLAAMVWDIYEHGFEQVDTAWLSYAYEMLKKEHNFWMTERLTPIGLNRFGNFADTADIQKFYGFLSRSRFPNLDIDSLDRPLFTQHAISECEASWDFTPRFDRRCEDFCPVDLNSNLYLHERICADISKILYRGEEDEWDVMADRRRALMHQYLWSNDLGCFVDYDFNNERQSNEITAAIFNALWAEVATPEQAKATRKALNVIEFSNGISPCEDKKRPYIYQWDYPNGWPPLQYLAVEGLRNYGFEEDAQRIATKYVHIIHKNFKKTKHLWEKYNVVQGNTKVKDEYKMPTMLGWTAGVYLSLSAYLAEEEK